MVTCYCTAETFRTQDGSRGARFCKWFGHFHIRDSYCGNRGIALDSASYVDTGHAYVTHRTKTAICDCSVRRTPLSQQSRLQYRDTGTSVRGLRGQLRQPASQVAFKLPRGVRACQQLIPAAVTLFFTVRPGHGDLCAGGHRAGCLDH